MSDAVHTAETRTAQPGRPRSGQNAVVDDRIGRFSILGELGAGGMGRVYAAYDPSLDRRIALKLLHDPGDEEHRRRLVLEAQALARLDHPNVVTVHDVGAHEGGLFIAMEFVSGGTLKQWLAANPVGSDSGRFERAVRLLVDAGNGLAAAHQADLVHRDVKPSNILVGKDGRARVADFGIVRGLPSKPARAEPSSCPDAGVLPTDDSGSGITRTGAVVGTPAYIAPEQFGPGEVRAAADQFSFCVTAWEMLFGIRPFACANERARLSAIRKGELRPPAGIPPNDKVLKLLQRGLRFRPAARHRTMKVLVDGLDEAIGGGRTLNQLSWRAGLAAGGLGLIGLAGGAYGEGKTGELCTGATAAFQEVWSEKRRSSVRGSILTSSPDFGPGVWRRVEATLDNYGNAWIRAHTEVCEATQIRHTKSTQRMAEQMACLNDAKRAVDALLRVLTSADPNVLAMEHELLAGLPTIKDCEGILELPTLGEELVLAHMAQASVLRNAGRTQAALDLIEPIALGIPDDAASTVHARVLLEYGKSLSESRSPTARRVLEAAYALAHRLHEQKTAGAAARALARLHARTSGRTSSIRLWYELGTAELESASTADLYEHKILEGTLAELEGDRTASRSFRDAVELARGDAFRELDASRRLAAALVEVDATQAVADSQRTLDSFEASFGSHHPSLPRFERSHARLLSLAGRVSEATHLSRKALDRTAAMWGASHPATAPYALQLAQLLCAAPDGKAEGARLASGILELSVNSGSAREELLAREAHIGCIEWSGTAVAVDAAATFLEHTLVFYGENSKQELSARAKYATTLLLDSDLAAAREQLHLSVSPAILEGNAWNRRTAAESHESLATIAKLLREPTIALQHAEAARSYQSSEVPDSPQSSTAPRLCMSTRLERDLTGAQTSCKFVTSAPLRVAVHKIGLATVLRDEGRVEAAAERLTTAVSLVREQLGGGSYLYASTRLELAEVQESLQLFTLAEEGFSESYSALRAVPDAGASLIKAGAGVARSAARRGDFVESTAVLKDLDRVSDRTAPIEQAYIAESRGFAQHLENPEEGAAEYERAIHFYRFTHSPQLVREACRASPFRVETCANRDIPHH